MQESYEISVWKGSTYVSQGQSQEEYICTIGSNTLTTQSRAREPNLKSNVNGSHTFSFTMYYEYIDIITGEKVHNVYVDYLFNETHLKVKWKGDWYDFIIKNIQEDSNAHTYTYECEDLFIWELGHNGYNLEFADDLNNSLGTAQELSERVLTDTDWNVDKEHSDIIVAEVEEAVYEISTDATIYAHKLAPYESDLEEIASGSNILLFESCVHSITDKLNQLVTVTFLWANNMGWKKQGSSMLVTNGSCYQFDGYWTETSNVYRFCSNLQEETIYFSISKNAIISNQYRGMKVTRPQKSGYNSVLKKNVNLFQKEGKYYGQIIESQSITPTVITNLILHGKEFTSINGWTGNNKDFIFKNELINKGTETEPNLQVASYLISTTGSITISNPFLKYAGSSLPDGIQIGDKFCLRYKIFGTSPDTNPLSAYIQDTNDSWSQPASTDWHLDDGWYTAIFEYAGSSAISKNDLVYDSSKAYFTITNTLDKKLGLLEAECFKVISGYTPCRYDATWPSGKQKWQYNASTMTYELASDLVENNYYYYEEKMKLPNTLSNETVVQQFYKYYKIGEIGETINYTPQGWSTSEDYQYDYIGIVEDNDYTPVYDDDCNQVRIINEKASNRFNILQKIAETFKCWIHFNIEHNTDGSIISKQILIRKEIGEDIGYGFVYGLDLKQIKRTVKSDAIATKTIVLPNNNEVALNGFCTIGRSKLNYSRANFILNFDYYIDKGLLNLETVYNDLYGIATETSPEGYLRILHRLNTQYDNITDVLTRKLNELDIAKTQEKVYQEYIDKSNTEIIDIKSYLVDRLSFSGSVWPSQKANYIEKTLPEEWRATDEYYLAKGSGPLEYKGKLTYNAYCSYLKRISSHIYVLSNSASTDTIEDDANDLILIEDAYVIINTDDWAKAESRYTVENKLQTWLQLYNSVQDYTKLYCQFADQVATLTSEVESFRTEQAAIEAEIAEADKDFYKKYSSYLSEGTWQSEDYSDDDKYYVDGVSVAYTSSRPQISYDISVVRLQALEEYKNRKFKLGDISYVEDPNFFGAGYRERVIISELTEYFESPEKDNVKVQNYRTQFEDLFQRIAASSQSLQYHEGEYKKIGDTLNGKGNIEKSVLQDSIEDNQLLVDSSVDNTITKGPEGITITDALNIARKVRLNSAGLFITDDGGNTWINAVKFNGINTNVLTAGVIDADQIVISGGKTFNWDASGITAYTPLINGSTDPIEDADYYEIKDLETTTYNKGQFVRFNGLGLFGIQGNKLCRTLNEVWENAMFSLTWNGLKIKFSDDSGGSMEINSRNTTNQAPGLYLKDSNNNILSTINMGLPNEKYKVGSFTTRGKWQFLFGGMNINVGETRQVQASMGFDDVGNAFFETLYGTTIYATDLFVNKISGSSMPKYEQVGSNIRIESEISTAHDIIIRFSTDTDYKNLTQMLGVQVTLSYGFSDYTETQLIDFSYTKDNDYSYWSGNFSWESNQFPTQINVDLNQWHLIMEPNTTNTTYCYTTLLFNSNDNTERGVRFQKGAQVFAFTIEGLVSYNGAQTNTIPWSTIWTKLSS